MSELGLAALYANQVARAIVRMDDRLSNFFLMPWDLPTIPLRSTYWALLALSLIATRYDLCCVHGYVCIYIYMCEVHNNYKLVWKSSV